VIKKQAKDTVLRAFSYFKTKADTAQLQNNSTLSETVAMERVTTLWNM